jgi:hypothetical protein
VREGGDASNLSVAVTRAFGDVDTRFGKYSSVYLTALALVIRLEVFAYGCLLVLVADICVAVAKKSEASARCLQVRAAICFALSTIQH